MQPAHETKLRLGPFSLFPCEARIEGRPAIEEWIGPLQFAIWTQRASPWWIGDLLIAGDARFGEAFSQACEGIISAESLQRYESIARRVPPKNRRASLSWSTHAMVARLPVADQPAVLDLTEKEGWTSEQLRKYLSGKVPRAKKGKPPAAPPVVTPPESEPA